MFIINCERDNSYCQVNDKNVIFDPLNVPKKDELVKFFYNNKEENGRVVMVSDNETKINKKLDMLRKDSKKRKLPQTSKEGNEASTFHKSKKINSKPDRSPSKEDLKKQLAEALDKIGSFGHLSAQPITKKGKGTCSEVKAMSSDSSTASEYDEKEDSPSIINDNDDDDDEGKKRAGNSITKENDNSVKNPLEEKSVVSQVNTDLNDPDLYGKDWPEETMVKLINHVYCKKTDYDLTISMCSQASHVVRRLIPGVFKPSGYLGATYSGQAPRAHGGNPPQVKPLNYTAKTEIIDFAMKLSEEKGWITRTGKPHTKEDLQKVMSQKIGELKRNHNLNNKRL